MAQPEKKYTSDFVINKNKNLTSNYDHDDDVDQVPFFLNSVGVPTMKGRVVAYKVEK
tara:strand:+ start:672 stop:842 length:171 start_codon:yes stop_codon:yes gene_type:complete